MGLPTSNALSDVLVLADNLQAVEAFRSAQNNSIDIFRKSTSVKAIHSLSTCINQTFKEFLVLQGYLVENKQKN